MTRLSATIDEHLLHEEAENTLKTNLMNEKERQLSQTRQNAKIWNAYPK